MLAMLCFSFTFYREMTHSLVALAPIDGAESPVVGLVPAFDSPILIVKNHVFGGDAFYGCLLIIYIVWHFCFELFLFARDFRKWEQRCLIGGCFIGRRDGEKRGNFENWRLFSFRFYQIVWSVFFVAERRKRRKSLRKNWAKRFLHGVIHALTD